MFCEVTPVAYIKRTNLHIAHSHLDNHSCVESYLPEGCHQNKGGTETTCTKFFFSLHTKGFRNKRNGLQALCLLHCLESSLISDGIWSSPLSSSVSCVFGRVLVFSLLVVLILQTDVYVTCALFLYFFCWKKKNHIFLMLLFPFFHRWNIYMKRKCRVIFLSSFLL